MSTPIANSVLRAIDSNIHLRAERLQLALSATSEQLADPANMASLQSQLSSLLLTTKLRNAFVGGHVEEVHLAMIGALVMNMIKAEKQAANAG